MKCDELKVYVPQDGSYGLEPEEGGKLVEEETCYLKSDVDAAIAELKQKLEDAKATAYAESVDAGMENRRLKRALWLARAELAKEKQQLFHFSLGYEKLCIDGFFDPYNGRKELSPKQWVKVFKKVENKCLDKAEEYR